MVRERDRLTHEHVDASQALRPALFLLGDRGAHLALGEDDAQTDGWTAEFWVCRASAQVLTFIHTTIHAY